MSDNEVEKVLRLLGAKAKDKAKDVWNDWKVKSLVEQALSDKQSVRVCARAKLKKQYPEVFAELEESKVDKRDTTNQDSSKSPTSSGEKSNPLPVGELYTKEDEDFHEYKRGFKF
jgi:hypothetical protein